jgi:ABC-2 type transport system ATP-binding protein
MVDEISPPLALERVSFRHPAAKTAADDPVSRGVEDVSLAVAAGEALGLLGPNGSGKSTILSLVAGLLAPRSGSVRLLGAPVSAALRRRLGVVFQEPSLDPLMTVAETLRLHGLLFGLGGPDLRRRSDDLLTRMGLTERADDRVDTLSGGLRRRLELARALLHAPSLLLLDEPALGLDPDSRGALWDLLDDVRTEGTALLLATNDVAEAERICDRVAFLQSGRIIATGAPADLRRELRHDSVRVEWPAAPAGAAATLAAMEGVGSVRTAAGPDAGTVLHVTVDDASAFVPALFALDGANRTPGGIAGVRIHESTLEDAYFQRVGEPLRAPDATEDAPPAANGRAS